MAYYLQFDGNSYVVAPTLGNVLQANTFKISTDKINWVSTGYWFSQASASGGTREIGLFLQSGTLRAFVGGSNQPLLNSTAIQDEFGTNGLVADNLTFEINMVTGAYSLSRDGNPPFNSGTISIGTGRAEGALFRVGARGSNDDPNSTGGAYIVPSGSFFGKTLVEIDGIPVREYNKQTLSGSNDTLFPDTVGNNDGTLVNFPTDNSQWIFYDDGGGAVDAPVTGVQANALLGSVVTTGSAVASTSGVFATGQVGDVTITTAQGVVVTGVQANALLGSVIATGSAVASTSGVFATGQVGDVSIITTQGAIVTGVQANTSLGTPTVSTGSVASISGLFATGEVGIVVAGETTRVAITGVQADASLGDIDVEIKTIIRVEGVSASAQAGRVNVWGAIQVAQDANWSNMNIPSSSNWSPIDY